MRRVAGLITLLHLGMVVSLVAQHLEPVVARWEPPATSFALEVPWGTDQRDTVMVPRRDYRYEGLAFGGIVFGAAGAWLGWNLGVSCPTVPGAECGRDRLGSSVAVGLTGAALGGGVGYLVGRLSSKPRPNHVTTAEPIRPSLIPDSTRRRVGYHHWKGAAIGAGSGALLGALLFLRGRGGCSDCDLTTADFFLVSVAGAGLGGTLGFLAGLASPKYESQPEKTTPE